ncbi:hypothetical protein BGZ96_005162 [Linnemannia gamsii]|uniref:Uncharacterized protein n=1 Tax=Linnemannia gamsii TaxID=64522 RepID=A0ABQ7KGP4_9FUNG|nr:hypothetical protein BGZ96_005162 [Linnemannia gamsii]
MTPSAFYGFHYAGVTTHAYMDGHLIAMTRRVPSDTSIGLTNNEVKEEIGRASRTIQDLIGVHSNYMKVHKARIKDSRPLVIAKSMYYSYVGVNLDDYNCRYSILDQSVSTIRAHGYDMVRSDGCMNDKYPYKKDPIKDNGYMNDAKAFGGQEYKHGQVNVNSNNYSPFRGGCWSVQCLQGATGGDRLTSSSALR